MRICGLKLTHDCSVTVIENDRLLCCHELEKINNNARFCLPESIRTITDLINTTGFTIQDFDQVIIDGWVGEHKSFINIGEETGSDPICVAGYQEMDLSENLLNSFVTGKLVIDGIEISYTSFKHVLGHILSAYCTSPFASMNVSSFVLVWDGGMFPRLYYVAPRENRILCIGELFRFGVNLYSIFAQHFRPFKINANVIKDELSIAGKVMAYTAFGKIDDRIIKDLEQTERECSGLESDKQTIPLYPYNFTKKFKQIIEGNGYLDEDIISSFHEFIKRKLVLELGRAMSGSKFKSNNLCLSGGAALNIKWNSAIRKANSQMKLWVCPFPNDSGSSIGAACAGVITATGQYNLKWKIYSGPTINKKERLEGWLNRKAEPSEIAKLLQENNLPVLLLQENAELGPRALGNRSILSSPFSPQMKEQLNSIKFRESYRPIAPVCMEEFSSHIFEPGGYDPFMLFDHRVKDCWRDKIPAVVHNDGTARLQTVNREDNPVLYEILSHFNQLTGIPVLCNTSANFKGSGFFPDLKSAQQWNKVGFIYDGETLFYWEQYSYQIFGKRSGDLRLLVERLDQ